MKWTDNLRDAETTILINFAFWRGSGRGGTIEGKLLKTLFLLGSSMTIKFGNFCEYYYQILFFSETDGGLPDSDRSGSDEGNVAGACGCSKYHENS